MVVAIVLLKLLYEVLHIPNRISRYYGNHKNTKQNSYQL